MILLSVALLLFISISYKTFLINPLTVEWALKALIDFTLSNARRFYSSMGNALDGKGLRSWDESKPNLRCGQISITHCLAAFSYVIQTADCCLAVCCWFYFCSERFSPGCSGFPHSSKTSTSKFQFDPECSNAQYMSLWLGRRGSHS